MDGWIKLHRKVLENPIVCKDSDHLAVWAYLLLNATHKEYQTIFKGEKITLQPGQLITGRKTISEKLKISESKVKRILLAFESDQQIARERSNKNSLISILNWEKYQVTDQQDDQQVTSNRPASDQQVTTNKNVKNDKNEKKNRYGETVYLTDEQYKRLIEDYGKEEIEYWIARLDEWQLDNPKKRKTDHNRTIRNWIRSEERRRAERKQSNKVVAPLPTVSISDEEVKRLDAIYKKRGIVG